MLDSVARPNPDWSGQTPDPGSSAAPYRLYNIGNTQPVELLDFIAVLEECLGRPAKKDFQPLQAGDVPETCADVDDLVQAVGFRPSTPLREGIARFVEWYRAYYRC